MIYIRMDVPMIVVMRNINLALRFSDEYILLEKLLGRNLRTIVDYNKKRYCRARP